jgi:hypothetical protein
MLKAPYYVFLDVQNHDFGQQFKSLSQPILAKEDIGKGIFQCAAGIPG